MSIASEITRLDSAKSALAVSIAAKGVTVPSTTKIDGYAALVDTITTGGGSSSYTPPADWIDIDTITDGNINLLVSDGGLATYAFICSTSTGTYHVDWGDGTSADFASAATAEHTYTKGQGQACSRGYTTFKVVISPNAGSLTAFAVTSHSLATQGQCHNILSCVIAATHLTTLANAFCKATAPTVKCYALERVNLVGTFTVLTDATSMFQSCNSLQSVDVSGMVAVTTATSMFQSCNSLQSVDVSGMVAVTTATQMFYNSPALQSVDVSGMVAVTTATSMFQSCNSLQSVDVSGMVAVTTASSMFNSCLSLQSVDVSGMVAVTNASSMFSSCYSLTAIMATNFARDATSVSFSDAFTNCEQLTEINFSAAKMTVLTAKGASGKLNKLATVTMHASSLLNGTNPTMDLQYNTLSAAQLDAIYTNLPTVTGKTINVTGCTGQATSTKSIATAKGWTVTPT